jgi:hypothetical protein
LQNRHSWGVAKFQPIPARSNLNLAFGVHRSSGMTRKENARF